MITIKVKPNENMNRVLSKFKSMIMNEGIMQITNQGLPNIDRKWLGFTELNSVKHLDRDLYLDRIKHLGETAPNRSKGYIYRQQLFEEYLGKEI